MLAKQDLLSSQGFKDAAERARIAAESSGKAWLFDQGKRVCAEAADTFD